METPAQPLEYQRVEPMLTSGQRKTLLYNKLLHERAPTLIGLLQAALPRLILSLGMFGMCGVLGWYLGVGWAVPFACGAAYIAVIRQIRHIQLICRSWPVLDRVMNWDEVDRLLAQPPKPAD